MWRWKLPFGVSLVFRFSYSLVRAPYHLLPWEGPMAHQYVSLGRREGGVGQ